MKCLALLLGGLVLAVSVGAQVVASESPVDEQANAQARARISLERQQQTDLLDEQDRACLSRFAVTQCQTAVAQRRLAMLARLKRQEVALNDAMRRQRARDQHQRTQEKISEDAQRRADAAAAPRSDDRQKRRDEGVLGRPKPASSDARESTAKVATPVDAKVLEENRKAYQEKLKELETRRQDRDKRLLEKGPAKATLPLPP